jgi:16S rRNA (uracil1498-N3)-methyltransferase
MGRLLVEIKARKSLAMRRYWVAQSQIQGQHVILDQELFHHIIEVCRQQVGSHFEVMTESHEAYFVEVIEVQKRKAIALIKETRTIQALPSPLIHLCVSVPRFPVLEAVIEKSVEMGVSGLHLFFSDFSFVKTASSLSNEKRARWQKIIVSATQQCGRGELMPLSEPQKLMELIHQINQDQSSVCLIAYEGATTLSVKQYLQKIRSERPQESIKNIWIFAGSEGGFSQQEVEAFQKLNLPPVTLGPQILRVETACMTLVSVLKYEFDLMR